MNLFPNRIRRSLAARLSLGLVTFAALIFIAALGYMFVDSQRAVRREAVNRATQILDNVVLRVNSILDDVQIAANNTDGLIYEHMDDPDAIMGLSRNVLANNPELNGCSISFEPDFFKEKGKYFSAYSYRENGSVMTVQEGSDEYQYFYMDWYLLPKLLNQPCWTEPFIDVDVVDDHADIITSYCKPLSAEDGSYAGSLSVDVSLSWLSETISNVKPYENSYSIMIGQGGAYLVHPDTTKLLYQTIFTDTLLDPNPEVSELGHAMLKGERGMRHMKVGDNLSYVFFEPVKETGWSVAIICPENDIFSGYKRLRRSVMAIALLGLLLMLYACRWFISRELDPLTRLTRQAALIAKGNFDVELPDTNRHDEIGRLTRSFRGMQSSLADYIERLTETTATKERIEGELRIAREIQMAMVPRVFPPFPERNDIDLYASMIPAKEVGGDLYDYYIQDEKLYFCVGDVSGKGIPGSLLMAVARNLFRVVSQQGVPPAKVARQINEAIAAENEQMMFMTIFFGLIDLKTGRMDYCNCGHNPPVLVSEGQSRFLKVKPNTPLGVCEDWDFEGETIQDVRGQAFLFYTDGLNEAENLSHEQFGNDRLLEMVGDGKFVSAQLTIEKMLASVSDFVGEAEASDDLTMLCFRIRKS
ncbi:MAG: SpoIIE family protein phosphatase [Bacteroidales bacterium]|nr:SpoIIE family protein phosphatase [Bacteroidales bacterium]